jgi:sigma-B regulation protein RsbU (phosphoserine phosphatase)
MSIRNRLLVLLLAIALTPLVLTSVLQQVSIRFASNRLAAKTQEALEANARLALQEQLQSHVEILERDRQLTDALLSRQAREVELRLATVQPPERTVGPERPFGPGGAGARPRQGFTRPDAGQSPPLGRAEPGPRGQRPFGPSVEFAQVDAAFGTDPNVDVPSELQHSYFDEQADPNSTALKVDYRSQSCFIVRSDDETIAKQAASSLASMTAVYGRIYTQSPEGTLWLKTTLATGVHTTYPGGVVPGDLSHYDPLRSEEWYRQALFAFNARRRPASREQPPEQGANPRGPDFAPNRRRFGGRMPLGRDRFRRTLMGVEARQGARMIDPFTGQWVVVRSMPVRYADGSFAGATALVRTIPEIFASMQLPERWGDDIERMLILVDPNAQPEPTAEILLHDTPQHAMEGRYPRPEDLSSRDPNTLHAMVSDILKGASGVRTMDYGGCTCLWAYQPLDIPQVAALLIVPRERVVGLARTMERSLLSESMFWLQWTTMVLLAVGIVAVIVAAMKARNLTSPIHALIDAGKRLGEGDYNAHVDIRTSDELEHLGRVFNETGPKLRDRERMKRSLELASAIQQNLLPDEVPDLRNFEVAGRCLYCDETGGDYYDFIDLSSGEAHRLALVIGDVSGHGIGSALLMAVTRGLLRAEAPHHLDDLGALMTRLNRELVHDTASEAFVTLFYGILDDRRRSLIWASAGHEPATLYRAKTARIEELPNTGMLLGVLPEAAFRQGGPVILEPGDCLVLGTDGIWEAHDETGRFFGKERLFQIVRDNASLSAEALCERIIEAVSTFVHPIPHSDDVTVIVVKAKP